MQARLAQGARNRLHHVGGAALTVFSRTGPVFCADAGLDLPSYLHCWPGECEGGGGRARWRGDNRGKASTPTVDIPQAATTSATADRGCTSEKKRTLIPCSSDWTQCPPNTQGTQSLIKKIFSMSEPKGKPYGPLYAKGTACCS